MDNNDLLRRLRYALRCDDSETSRLIKLGGGVTSTALAARLRAKETEPEFTACGSEVVAQFLDGLILENRGPREAPAASPWPDRSKTKPAPPAVPEPPALPTDSSTADNADAKDVVQMNNNIVLKQLRIALSLRSDDIHNILKSGGSALSASEAGALFRKPDARNYRQCGDQVLRQFIAGLVKRREQESKDSD